jgi:flagellin
MSGIVLSSAVRTNLTTLQNTSALQGKIQEKLSTGKKVNSALDNPSSFFTASSLNRRANDLSSLMDSMQQGVKTLEAADNAMKSITKNIESMQANIRQARQDKSFKGTSFTIDATTIGTSSAKNLTFSGGSVGTTPVNVGLQAGTGPVFTAGSAYTALDTTTGDETYAFTVSKNGGAAVSVTLDGTSDGGDTNISLAEAVTAINTQLTAGSSTIRARDSLTTPGQLEFYDSDATNVGTSATIDVSAVTTGGTTPSADGTIGFTGNPAAVTGGVGIVRTVDEMVTAINANAGLTGKVKASNDGGKLRIENQSTEALSVVGASATAVTGATGASATQTIAGNDVRKGLISQFNELRNQLDKLAGDASYNGVNLVKADKLKITFNETGTSTLDIQAKNTAGTVRGIGTESSSLDIGAATAAEFDSDAALDARLEKLSNALTTVQTQSGEFGAALTTVQNRQEFTKAMINTLQTGADNLTLADSNEEAAKLLSLNTRQQLSQTALSLASQADQAVLRLF